MPQRNRKKLRHCGENRIRTDAAWFCSHSAHLLLPYTGFERNPDGFNFLGFSRWPTGCLFSWFCLRYLRLWNLLQPEASEKIVSRCLQPVDISTRLTLLFFLHDFGHSSVLAACQFAGIDLRG